MFLKLVSWACYLLIKLMNKVRMPLKSRGRKCLRTVNRSPAAFSMESLPGWHPRSQYLRHLGPSLAWREMILMELPQVCIPCGCFQHVAVIKKAWTLCTGPSSPYEDWRGRVTCVLCSGIVWWWWWWWADPPTRPISGKTFGCLASPCLGAADHPVIQHH